MKLLSMRPSRYEGLYVLTVEHEGVRERLTLPDAAYAEAGLPAVGEELNTEAYAILKAASDRRASLLCALNTLSYGDKSRRELYRKLIEKGFDRETAEDATEEAVRLGYVDEERQLRHILPRLANEKLHGARRILPELVHKGYQSGQIRAILSELVETGEIDFPKNFERLLEKTHTDPNDKEARRKLAFRYGYSS